MRQYQHELCSQSHDSRACGGPPNYQGEYLCEKNTPNDKQVTGAMPPCAAQDLAHGSHELRRKHQDSVEISLRSNFRTGLHTRFA